MAKKSNHLAYTKKNRSVTSELAQYALLQGVYGTMTLSSVYLLQTLATV